MRVVCATNLIEVGDSDDGGALDEVVIDSEEFKGEVDKSIRDRMEFYNRGAMKIVKKELSLMALKFISKFSIKNKMTTESMPVKKYMDFAKELITQEVKDYKSKYF